MQYLLKIGGGGWFCANNGKFPVDGDDAVMIPLVTPKERNQSRLWDSSAVEKNFLVNSGSSDGGFVAGPEVEDVVGNGFIVIVR